MWAQGFSKENEDLNLIAGTGAYRLCVERGADILH